MAQVFGRTCFRPVATAFAQTAQAQPTTAQLHSLSQVHVRSVACNLRAWHARHQHHYLKHNAKGCRTLCSASQVAEPQDKRRKIVFLGTPEVAADVLFKLFRAARMPEATFRVAAVVTQPAKERKPQKDGTPRAPIPLPVQALAEEWLAPEHILCPKSASDEKFLDSLRALQPDLCLTAAYGNYLPTKFLSIPKFGTANIHPSLLPKYRGAAPVQRALQDGVTESGVTLLYTVKAMDAGPVIAQEKMHIDNAIQADSVLFHLFAAGTKLFLDNLDSLLSGEAQKAAQPQDESQVSHAAKIDKQEGRLVWDKSAEQLHNQVRAFTPWPGCSATFMLESLDADIDGLNAAENNKGNSKETCPETEVVAEKMTLKVLKTVVGKAEEWKGECMSDVTVTKHALHVKCNDGSVLSILQVQKAGKKPVSIQAFANGDLQNTRLRRSVAQTLDN